LLLSQNFTIRKKTITTIHEDDYSTKSDTIDLSSIHFFIKYYILLKLKKLNSLAISFSEVKELMTFCSDKVDDFFNKLNMFV
jgi:hypothetical protein